MAIKKLTDGSITMNVIEARIVEGKYGAQVMFVGIEENESEDTVLYISERSAVRQLERLSLSLEGCSGENLRFDQIQKDGKTYNNIYRAGAGSPAATRSAPVSAPKTQDQIDAMADLYNQCLTIAYRSLSALAEDQGVEFASSDIVAATATLFIQANKR